MSRKRDKPSKSKKNNGGVNDYSQRMSRLKSQALVRVAQTAFDNNLYFQSAALLEKALRRDPANVRLMADLALVRGKMRDYAEAEELLDRAAKLAPRQPSTLCMIAKVYATIARPEQATDYYRRALALNAGTSSAVETLVDLSALYERRHLLDEARQLIDDALERDPAHEKARLQQAVIDRRSGDLDRCESRLRALLGAAQCSVQISSSAWHELGQLLDSVNRFDEAFQATLNAKQSTHAESTKAHLANEYAQAQNYQLLQALSAQHYDHWAALAEDDAPYRCALMTSYPRSGTTLAEQVLDSHDDFVSADEFDVMDQWVFRPIVQRFPANTPLLDIIEKVPAPVRHEARSTYWQRSENIFGEPIGNRMMLDKNPALTQLLPWINWAFPEMRLLIALRDPRDVVLSCFMQNVQPNMVSVNWSSLDRAAAHYAQTMKTWLKIRELTRSKWLEFRYEDMVENLEAEAHRLLNFLDLPWDSRVLKFHERARQKTVRSPTYAAVTKPVYRGSIGRWKNYSQHFERAGITLTPFLKEFGYDKGL